MTCAKHIQLFYSKLDRWVEIYRIKTSQIHKAIGLQYELFYQASGGQLQAWGRIT